MKYCELEQDTFIDPVKDYFIEMWMWAEKKTEWERGKVKWIACHLFASFVQKQQLITHRQTHCVASFNHQTVRLINLLSLLAANKRRHKQINKRTSERITKDKRKRTQSNQALLRILLSTCLYEINSFLCSWSISNGWHFSRYLFSLLFGWKSLKHAFQMQKLMMENEGMNTQ